MAHIETRAIWYLFIVCIHGLNGREKSLRQSHSKIMTRREIVLSTVSIGDSRNVSATISFTDTRAICTIFWTNGYLGNNIMEYDSFYKPHKAEAELNFIDKQREHLKKVRNALNDHVSDLGVSYRCILTSTGFDKCTVIHMNMNKSLIAAATVYGNDTKIAINNTAGESMNQLLGGSYLNLLKRDAIARLERWNEIRRGILQFDGGDVFKTDFRTLYGNENKTVCQTWTTNVVQFSLSLEGSSRNITTKEVAEDWSSRYARVSINTSEGEDVSKFVCVLRAATGWYVRYPHPAYKRSMPLSATRQLTTMSTIETVTVMTSVITKASTIVPIPVTTESPIFTVHMSTKLNTTDVTKQYTITRSTTLEPGDILDRTNDYFGVTEFNVGHESMFNQSWAIIVTVSLVMLMGILCTISVICYKRARTNVLDVEKIRKRWQAIFVVNRYKKSDT